MDYISSNSSLLLEKSMNFLWTKQSAILDNISNVETPNYKTKVVTFEETLKQRLEVARTSANPRTAMRSVLDDAQFAVTEYQESTRADGNGVNLTEQTTELVRNSYQLQYVMQAISSDLSELRSAISGT